MQSGQPHKDLLVREVDVSLRALSKLEPLIGAERYGELLRVAAVAGEKIRGQTFWNVNSTSAGGGVAEMLQVLVGYALDAGIDTRWLVMAGDSEFFIITKRIHNRLHGAAGDGGALGPSEIAHYGHVTSSNAASMIKRVRKGDVVLLHDPQTAGMASALAEAGARVVWRSHVGRERTNEWTDQAWSFLRPHLAACEAYIFSLSEYVPPWIDETRTWVIPPSIDPFSPKNQDMAQSEVARALHHIGMLAGDAAGIPARFTGLDGKVRAIERRASILSDGPRSNPATPLVVQVSRWDRLKDMTGVMLGFASSVAGRVDADLALVGPSMGGVTDDPEGAEVFADCVAAWESLPVATRRRIKLVSLPMDDIDENAAMVNAIQRHSTVIVQKSLEEGFGLTVAEGMWKARAVVASKVGGITKQIDLGTGILLEDPTDLVAYGNILAALLSDPDEITQLGARARSHVLDTFLGDKHLIRYAHLIEWLVTS
jgi:trehalose synthase